MAICNHMFSSHFVLFPFEMKNEFLFNEFQVDLARFRSRSHIAQHMCIRSLYLFTHQYTQMRTLFTLICAHIFVESSLHIRIRIMWMEKTETHSALMCVCVHECMCVCVCGE